MKNYSKVLGIIALVAVIGLSMTACSMLGGDKGGGFGAPGAPSVSKAPALPDGVTFPATENDAISLISTVDSSVGYKLKDAFWAAVRGDFADYDTTIAGVEYSYSVNITDSQGKFKALLTNTDGSVPNATITKASSRATVKRTGTSNYYLDISRARKATFTFGLSDTIVTGYWIGGVVTVNYTTSSKDTLLDPNITGQERETSNSKTVQKVSGVLTIVRKADNKGAKFRWSSAEQTQGTSKKITSKDQEAYSDLEIYEGNTKKFVVQRYMGPTIF